MSESLKVFPAGLKWFAARLNALLPDINIYPSGQKRGRQNWLGKTSMSFLFSKISKLSKFSAYIIILRNTRFQKKILLRSLIDYFTQCWKRDLTFSSNDNN